MHRHGQHGWHALDCESHRHSAMSSTASAFPETGARTHVAAVVLHLGLAAVSLLAVSTQQSQKERGQAGIPRAGHRHAQGQALRCTPQHPWGYARQRHSIMSAASDCPILQQSQQRGEGRQTSFMPGMITHSEGSCSSHARVACTLWTAVAATCSPATCSWY